MNIEEAYNTIKKSVEAINTRPYATKAEYEKVECIKVLLTAYEKEKGENVKLRLQDIPLIEGELKAYKDRVNELKQELEKEKNKELKWKPIKEYDRKKYDWVLVKYFDGDYECVPEVAERRNDGKWYTSERQIPFEVKYFFDMQEILKEE
jgi:hypothetical protein